MSSIVLKGSTSGDVTVQAPAVATGTVTMPSASGTLLTTTGDGSGLTNLPSPTTAVAKIEMSTTQSLTKNVAAKINFDSEVFDTQGWFDSTTNYRFTPTTAGYYLVILDIVKGSSETQANNVFPMIYKNGSMVKKSYLYAQTPYYGYAVNLPTLSDIVHCNGSTDYIEGWFEWGANGTLNINNVSAMGNKTTLTFCKVD